MSEADGLVLIEDTSRISFDLPNEITSEIGRAIVSFSQVETIAEIMIWDLLGLNYDDGRLITSRMQADGKMALLRQLIERPQNQKVMLTKHFWKAMKSVAEVRARIAHGTWVIVDGHDVMIISHRFSGPSNTVMSEKFSARRLIAFSKVTRRLKSSLQEISDILGLPPSLYDRLKDAETKTRLPNPE